jgi:hypothetical protein
MARVMAVAMDVMDRPWQWGAADCCTAACDVFLRLHGIDPMEPLRGRYSSRLGALRLIAQEGGFLAMGDRLAARAGLVECEGAAGDIGVIRDATGVLALGIRTESGWVGKTERGLATAQMMRAWRVA